MPWIIPEDHPASARWNDGNNPKSAIETPMNDACESWSIWAVLNRPADRIGEERNQPYRSTRTCTAGWMAISASTLWISFPRGPEPEPEFQAEREPGPVGQAEESAAQAAPTECQGPGQACQLPEPGE